ncbi:MAG TPA: FMN-binding negative transcriptional regulator [Burkholderiaceae bacterium]|nr:FMN-binding negative transcriptional regulator [Burkholderiaceae bacterium]
MYVPTHFAMTDRDAMHRVIREHPLGMLVVQGPEGLDANHLPLELDASVGPWGRLVGHVARANPVWHEVPSGAEVLVVFRGPAGYVSPNWYPSKHETHRQVPTWNYEVVHAHGTFVAHDDPRHVRGVVARLTRTHEASEPRPWRMGDAPPDYLDAMVGAIVGIEIDIVRLVGKSKLSQNKAARDRAGAIDALRERERTELADAMRRAAPDDGTAQPAAGGGTVQR